MPKTKTHSGTKKRFRFSGTGKVMHKQAGKTHLNEHKSNRIIRRLEGDTELTGGGAKKIKKLLNR